MAIQEIIDAAKNVKPYAEKDSRKIVSFEDSVALANMEGWRNLHQKHSGLRL